MPETVGARRNAKKSARLGMPLGTASARLRKAVTLHLLRKLGEDLCYRCGEKIALPEELGLDHKLPGLDRSVELFWDLSNIAFSHRACNKQHGRRLPYVGGRPLLPADQRKRAQLGMPIGTATNRLKRMVLFDLVRRAGEDSCFVCGTTIRTIEALTIEHKKSWYSGNTRLFWDVYNIAFSHAKCNRSEPKRIEGPQGTSWCSTHQDFAPVAEFRKGTRWNGLAGDCNDCHRRELREYQRRRRALRGSNSNIGT